MKITTILTFIGIALLAMFVCDEVVISQTTNTIPDKVDVLLAPLKAHLIDREMVIQGQSREITNLNRGPQTPLPTYVPNGLLIRQVGDGLWVIKATDQFALIPGLATNGVAGEVFLKRR